MDKFIINGDVLIKYTADEHTVVIPSVVRKIETEAFEDKDNLQVIIIPENVNEIAYSAIYNCKNLKYVAIHSVSTELSQNSFLSCSDFQLFAPVGSVARAYAERTKGITVTTNPIPPKEVMQIVPQPIPKKETQLQDTKQKQSKPIVHSQSKKTNANGIGIVFALVFFAFIVAFIGRGIYLGDMMLYPKQKNDLWGYVDENGKEMIPFIYEDKASIKNFHSSEDIAVVKKDGKWGAVNYKNKTIIPFEYNEAITIRPMGTLVEYVFLEKDGKWGVVDSKNKLLADFVYETDREELDIDRHLVACLKKDNKWGALGYSGKEVIPFIYDEYFFYRYSESDTASHLNFVHQEGYAVVSKNGKWGAINTKNETLVDFRFDEFFDFGYENKHSGKKAAMVCKDGKCGAVDSDGNTIVEFKYDKCCCFSRLYYYHKFEFCGCDCFITDAKSPIDYIREELESMGYEKK